MGLFDKLFGGKKSKDEIAEALSEAAKGLIEQIPQNKREEIYDLVKKGEKIKAIEKVREIGGFGLAEAKRLVDDLQQNMK